MRKLKSQQTEDLWTTDWWELAPGVQAVVRTAQGKSSIKVKASAPSPLHTINTSLPPHWQASQSTDITQAVAAGPKHDLKNLLDRGVTMHSDSAEDWSIEVDASDVDATLESLSKNYEQVAHSS